MKVLSVVVHKLWPRLKFLSTDDNNDAGAKTIVLPTFITANYKAMATDIHTQTGQKPDASDFRGGGGYTFVSILFLKLYLDFHGYLHSTSDSKLCKILLQDVFVKILYPVGNEVQKSKF